MPDKVVQQYNIGMVVIIIIGLAGLRLFDLAVRKFFKKNVDTEYVTAEQCTTHRAEIKEQTDYKIETSKTETHTMLKEISKTISSQNDHLETMNETLVIGIMNNDSLTDEQKQKSVIDLSTRKKK